MQNLKTNSVYGFIVSLLVLIQSAFAQNQDQAFLLETFSGVWVGFQTTDGAQTNLRFFEVPRLKPAVKLEVKNFIRSKSAPIIVEPGLSEKPSVKELLEKTRLVTTPGKPEFDTLTFCQFDSEGSTKAGCSQVKIMADENFRKGKGQRLSDARLSWLPVTTGEAYTFLKENLDQASLHLVDEELGAAATRFKTQDAKVEANYLVRIRKLHEAADKLSLVLADYALAAAPNAKEFRKRYNDTMKSFEIAPHGFEGTLVNVMVGRKLSDVANKIKPQATPEQKTKFISDAQAFLGSLSPALELWKMKEIEANEANSDSKAIISDVKKMLEGWTAEGNEEILSTQDIIIRQCRDVLEK